MNTKIKELCSQLNELGELESSYFKARAYKNAALVLQQNFSDDLALLNCNDFTYLDGIGSGIDRKIKEFLETGFISKLQELRDANRDYLDPRFYKVREGFITKKIGWNEADALMEKFWNDLYTKVVHLIYNKLRSDSVVAGSYRRMKDYIGDLDILVPDTWYPEMIEFCDRTYNRISGGSSKSQYLLDPENNIPLDIISYTSDNYIYQLLYLTGSRETNIRMRQAANKKGLTLNQYGLWDGSENVLYQPSDEEEVFRFLDIDYLKPEER